MTGFDSSKTLIVLVVLCITGYQSKDLRFQRWILNFISVLRYNMIAFTKSKLLLYTMRFFNVDPYRHL